MVVEDHSMIFDDAQNVCFISFNVIFDYVDALVCGVTVCCQVT